MKQYVNAEPIKDRIEILRLLMHEERKWKFLVAPDTVRVRIYSDGICMDEEYYKVDPGVVACLMWDDAVKRLEPFPRRPAITLYVISAQGEQEVADTEKVANAA